jgi:seryl-tRNA(Sec) selenium transferase
LRNPRLREEDLVAALRRDTASRALTEVAAESSRWREHYAVRLALALQPRTPLPLTLLQLSSLRKADLIRVARTKGLPTLVQAAALATVERMAGLRRP